MAKSKPPKTGKSARVLLRLIREPENFRAHLDAFESVQRDFYLDYHEKFLATVDEVRALLKKRDEAAMAERFASLPGPFQEALLEFAVDEALAGFFERAVAASTDGAQRRALKQAVHRLKARGVAVPVTERKAVFRPLPAEANEPVAYASTVDGAGESVVLLAVPSPRGGVRLLQAFLNHARGVVEFHQHDASRSDARKLIAQIHEGGIVTLVKVEPAFALFAVARARRLIRERNLAAPEGFVSSWNLATAGMAEPPGHPAWGIDGAADAARRTDLLNRSDKLHDLPELRHWVMDQDTLRRFGLRLQERETSRLVIGDDQSKDYVENLIARTVEEYFGPEMRAACAASLEDTAYLLDRLERREDAHACLAAARALNDAETPLAAIPFARRMLTKLMRDQPAKPEEKATPSGIVLP